MSRARRAVLGLLAVALVLVAPATVAGAAGAAGPLARQDDGAAAEPDPFDPLAECMAENGRLLVLLLVDESDSVRSRDPEDQRVAGALTALDSLDRLRGTDAEGSEVQIDVMVSTFSDEFTPVSEWTPLDEVTRDGVADTISSLADREYAKDSDFHNALVGAQTELAAQQAVVAEDGGEACTTLLMFADGDYVLDTRSTPEEEQELGVTKDYAPDVELTTDEAVAEAIDLGTEALCAPGGVVDQIRAEGTTLVALELGRGSELLEAIATGTGGEVTCGAPGAATAGVYLSVDESDDLLATFDLIAARISGGDVEVDPEQVVPCPDQPCDEGAVRFVVDPDLRGVHILAGIPSAGTTIVLEPPEGDPLEIAAGEDASTDVGGIPVVARWVAEESATVDLEVPDGGGGEGEWRISLVGDGDEPGLIQVVTLERGVDQAKRVLLAVVLMAVGLLAPLGLLVLINVATTRFQDLSNVRATRVPVMVAGHGQVLRTDGGLHVLRLPEGDFEDLEGLGENREFTWRGLVFRARTPLNPFAEPHATVAPEGGTADVAREAQRTDIALGLAGSWMFLLDQDATRAAEREDEIHGELVAFVAAEAAGAQTARLITDVEARLPATARSLARIADVRGGGAPVPT